MEHHRDDIIRASGIVRPEILRFIYKYLNAFHEIKVAGTSPPEGEPLRQPTRRLPHGSTHVISNRRSCRKMANSKFSTRKPSPLLSPDCSSDRDACSGQTSVRRESTGMSLNGLRQARPRPQDTASPHGEPPSWRRAVADGTAALPQVAPVDARLFYSAQPFRNWHHIDMYPGRMMEF